MKEPCAELLRRAQAGDVAAFGRLLLDTQDAVYNLAYGVLRHPQEAQDMTQEVYLRVWRALPTFRGEAAFGTWLYRVTVNACLNRRRRLRPQLTEVDGDEALEGLADAAPDPLSATIQQERRERLWALVDALPDKYRLVILLFYQQQLSYEEISEVLALPLGTVKAQLNRARAALARLLTREPEKSNAIL